MNNIEELSVQDRLIWDKTGVQNLKVRSSKTTISTDGDITLCESNFDRVPEQWFNRHMPVI